MVNFHNLFIKALKEIFQFRRAFIGTVKIDLCRNALSGNLRPT